jgi:hypothetical protein
MRENFAQKGNSSGFKKTEEGQGEGCSLARKDCGEEKAIWGRKKGLSLGSGSPWGEWR